MCVVYEARDRHHGDIVALKTLRHLDPPSLYRLKQEFRALSHLDHPNLVQFYELLRSDDGWFVTMERVEGVDFLRWCRSDTDPRLAQRTTARTQDLRYVSSTSSEGEPPAPHRDPGPLPDLIRLRSGIVQLVEGVRGLHAAGRIHRDLKPSNVLVTDAGRVVVLDFGLVAEVDPDYTEGTLHHQIAGSAAYMSPEQAMGRALTAATDWYAVGVMLYEALTGVWPFGGHIYQILHDKQRLDPVPPRTLVPQIPDDLDQLAMELLRRDPEARPRGAQILARLRADLVGMPVLEPLFRFRDTELRAVMDRWRQIEGAGRPWVLAIRALPGVGRTRFLRELVKELRRAGAVVLKARCYPWEGVPLRAIDGLVDNLTRVLLRADHRLLRRLANEDLSHLVALFPTFARVDALDVVGAADDLGEAELRRRAMAELRTVLDVVAEARPLVLAIDDAQHADPESADALATLLAPRSDAPALPALVLVSYPSQPQTFVRWLSPLLEAIEVPLEALDLDPLDPEQATDLAAELLGLRDNDPVAHAVAVASGGNLSALHARTLDVLVAEGQRAEIVGQIDEVVACAIDGLPPDPRRLLEILAVAAAPIPTPVALAAATPGDPFQAITALRAHRLVARSGEDTLQVAVGGVADYVLGRLSGPDGSSRHRRLAEALARRGSADPRTLVRHWTEAGDQEQAAMVAWSGGLEAREGGRWAEAVWLLRRALDHDGWSPRERASILACLAEVLFEQGSGLQASRRFRQAAEVADAVRRLSYRGRAAEAALSSGHVTEGLALLAPLLRDLGLPPLPSRTWAPLLARWRRIWRPPGPPILRPRHQVDRTDLARVDAAEVAAVALAVVDPVRAAAMGPVFQRQALMVGEVGRCAAALAMSGVGSDLMALAAARPDDDRVRAAVSGIGGRAALGMGRLDQAIEAARDAEISWRRAGGGGRLGGGSSCGPSRCGPSCGAAIRRGSTLRSGPWWVGSARPTIGCLGWSWWLRISPWRPQPPIPRPRWPAWTQPRARGAGAIAPRQAVLIGIGRSWLLMALGRRRDAWAVARRLPLLPDPWIRAVTLRALATAAIAAGDLGRARAAAVRLVDSGPPVHRPVVRSDPTGGGLPRRPIRIGGPTASSGAFAGRGWSSTRGRWPRRWGDTHRSRGSFPSNPATLGCWCRSGDKAGLKASR